MPPGSLQAEGARLRATRGQLESGAASVIESNRLLEGLVRLIRGRPLAGCGVGLMLSSSKRESGFMNLDFSEEQKMLQKAARDFLAEQAPLERVREIFEGDEPMDRDLWKAAAEMGWLGTAVPEKFGGAGFGHLELAMIAEELGRGLAPIPVSSSVYLASEAILRAGKPEQQSEHLPGLVSGERIGTFALAEQPGSHSLASLQTRFRDGRLTGTKLPVPDGDVADLCVVVARSDSGAPCLALVDLTGQGVSRRSLRSMDASRSHASIEFDEAPAELLGGSGEGEALVSELLDRAAVLVAFEQLGGAQACLDMARDYAMDRYAFGRPIGSFQGLKHRFADLFASVELARPNCYYGAWALSSESDELGIAACNARISATEAYALAAEENLQIHGGVGFTWEYDCHLYLRRAKLLALSLGPVGLWKDRLIDRLEARNAT